MSGLVAAGGIAKLVALGLATLALHGTLLALLALVLVRLGKPRPAWQAAVWLVVLAKFALPWGPALPWSLSDLLAGLGHHAAAGTVAATAAQHAAPVLSSPWPALGWLALVACWLTGVVIVLAHIVGSQRLAARMARGAQPAPVAAQDLLAELAARLRVRAPALVILEDVSPHVVGVLRATIVIPSSLLADPRLLRAALLHELAHVRRRDALARLVQLWATAIFWCWPVVQWASRRLELAREAACDAWALEASELPRPTYARLLVRMAALHTAPAIGLAMPHSLDARVAAVLGPPVRARIGLPHKLALVVWVAVALGGARSAAGRGEPVCKFTPQLAEALFLAHPEADLDGDGTLSRDEACELQASLRRKAEAAPVEAFPVSVADAELKTLLDEPLCCNCDQGAGSIDPASPWRPEPVTSCEQGVDR